MPIRNPGRAVPQADWNNRDWSKFLRDQIVTPDPESVTPETLAPDTVTEINNTATAAANTAIAGHVEASDPHPQYATDAAASALAANAQATAIAQASADLTAHEDAADPHPVYLTQTEGDARYSVLSNVLNGSATYDPPSLADGAAASTTVTVTGAALNDFALASFSLSTQGISLSAMVTASNTVTVVFFNKTGGVLDLASGTLKARVWK